MSVGAVFDKIGTLGPQQDAIIRCEGGYNKQPPLYSLDFMLANSQGRSEITRGVDDVVNIHTLCMKKVIAHLEMLKETAPEELKYYR